MNKHLKHLIVAVAALMLLSSPALACGGKSCSSRQCGYKVGQAQKCTSGDQSCAVNKKGDTRIPDKRSQASKK